VAFSLTPAKLKEMWIIPLGFVLITGLSALVAWVLARIFKLKRSQT
jgi:predicted permease